MWHGRSVQGYDVRQQNRFFTQFQTSSSGTISAEMSTAVSPKVPGPGVTWLILRTELERLEYNYHMLFTVLGSWC